MDKGMIQDVLKSLCKYTCDSVVYYHHMEEKEEGRQTDKQVDKTLNTQ